MARIEWGHDESRIYEYGLDRGVLYLPGKSGVPWNGLTSVIVDPERSALEPLYFDGVLYNHHFSSPSFLAKLTAFTYPEEFEKCFGLDERWSGLIFKNQPRQTFGLTYRTLIDNDLSGNFSGYKIHILYGLSATMTAANANTISDNAEAEDFEWFIKTKPTPVSNVKRTAYVIVDSRYLNPENLVHLENVLYGSENTSPWLPSLQALIDLVPLNFKIVIIDNGDGTWSADAPEELLTMLDDTTFSISEIDATYLDTNTYDASSTVGEL